MARPKHRTKSGATYFVTTDTWRRRELFRHARAAEIVVRKILEYRDRGFYVVHCFVVMPDHLHIMVTPGENTTLERVVQLIKGGSSHEIGARFPVWHAGFTEHEIRDQRDYDQHVNYIHLNPVEGRLAENAEGYSFSSASGRFPLDAWPVVSGAKAPVKAGKGTAGLKPRPSERAEDVAAGSPARPCGDAEAEGKRG